MRFTTRSLLLPLLGALAIGIAACSGGDGDAPTETDPVVLTPLPDDVLLPTVISGDLAVGENRFLVGLQDQETGELVLGADLSFAFFLLDSDEGTLKFERTPEPIVITRSYTHKHDDGGLAQGEHILIGVVRQLAAFCPTPRAGHQTATIARRLERGDKIYEETDYADDDSHA